MDLKELGLVDPDRHWYYQAKLRAMRSFTSRWPRGPRSIIDVGAGSGFFSLALADFDAGDTVVCVDPNYETDRVERSGALRFARSVDAAEIHRADLLLFVDVLEHVEDDLALLRSYTEHARLGARAVITVPAFMSMWSAHDVFLGHYRRYRLREAVVLAEKAGLAVSDAQYLFGSILPAAWVVRRARRGRSAASDLKAYGPLVNSALLWVLSGEHAIGANRFGGLSALVVAEVVDGRGPDLKRGDGG